MWKELFLVCNLFPVLKAAFVRCGNSTYPVKGDITHSDDSSGILVTWDLLSHNDVCSDPPRAPVFLKRHLHEVAVIASCEQCPKCTVRLPQKFELPLGISITTLYVLTRQVPNYKFYTDLDVRFILVEKIPPSLRNCEIVFRETSKKEGISFYKLFMFICVFISVLFCVCGARCCFAKII